MSPTFRCLVLVLMVSAAPLWASPCPGTSLQDYFAMPGGCTHGGVEFSDFYPVPGIFGAIPIDADNIGVGPIGGMTNPGLQFGLRDMAAAGEILDIIFHFRVTGPIIGAQLMIGPTNVLPDGVVSVLANLCLEGQFDPGGPVGCTGTQVDLLTFDAGFDAQLTDQRMFAPQSFFDVFIELTLDGGLAGSADLDIAKFSVILVPEPASYLLILGGLAVLVARRIRRNL